MAAADRDHAVHRRAVPGGLQQERVSNAHCYASTAISTGCVLCCSAAADRPAPSRNLPKRRCRRH